MHKITIRRNKETFQVKHVERKVTIKSPKKTIKIFSSGKRGLPGKDGLGVPEGGNPGDVMTKTETGTKWQHFEGTDKYFEQSFSITDSLLITHNLNKYPAVSVTDSAGDEIEGSVSHENLNQLSVTFSAPFSGKIICN